MKISLIIPAYNEEKYLPACLSAVSKNMEHFFEVIVVDNGSTDKTAEIARSFAGVKVVLEESKGATFARMRGLREAKGDILAYIDADTRMPEGWIQKVIHAHSTNKNLVCVSGPYVFYDTTRTFAFFTWIYWHVFARILYAVIGYMIVGGNFAVKKDALLSIGGFDKSIEFYGDDTDLAKRLHKVGKVLFLPSLSMYTSVRRFKGEGFMKTTFTYVLNFFSIVSRGRPATIGYKDIR